MDVDVATTQPKRRAPRCNRLDEPQIRKEIEVLYSVLLWKVEDIRTEINKTHNLNATKYQYRDRLHKWGCRQRLNNQQYHKVYRDLTAREKSGKASSVVLNGIVNISDKRLKKWASRNITFTEKMFGRDTDLQMENDSNALSVQPLVAVHTPPSSDTLPLVITRRHIPLSTIYSLPIWQASKSLERIVDLYLIPRQRGNSTVSKENLAAYYPVLRAIVYQISNNFLGRVCMDKLLDSVDRLGAREALQRLLADNSPSILATCESLVKEFYRREDYDMLESVRKSHPEFRIQLYDILGDIRTSGILENRDYFMRVLRDIQEYGAPPESVDHVMRLLSACKVVSGDITIFLKLWDPERVSVKAIDETAIKYHRPDNSALCTDNPAQLEVLLELGFTAKIWTLLLRAILLDNFDIAMLFFRHLRIKLPAERPEFSTSKCIWRLMDEATFAKMIHNVAVDAAITRRYHYYRHWMHCHDPPTLSENDIEDWLITLLACIRPDMTDYIVQVLRRKYFTTRSQVCTWSIDLIYWQISDETIMLLAKYFGSNWNFIRYEGRVLALERFLNFGVDPNKTELWQETLWGLLAEGGTLQFGGAEVFREVLKLLLDAGADLDIDLELEFVDQINREFVPHTQVCGFRVAKPIDLVFVLPDPAPFCALLQPIPSGALDSFVRKLTLFSTTKAALNPDFIQAVCDRNLDQVRLL
ncbi:hypothetical protein TWF281_004576 [Arthrobotrys megalospora]